MKHVFIHWLQSTRVRFIQFTGGQISYLCSVSTNVTFYTLVLLIYYHFSNLSFKLFSCFRWNGESRSLWQHYWKTSLCSHNDSEAYIAIRSTTTALQRLLGVIWKHNTERQWVGSKGREKSLRDMWLRFIIQELCKDEPPPDCRGWLAERITGWFADIANWQDVKNKRMTVEFREIGLTAWLLYRQREWKLHLAWFMKKSIHLITPKLQNWAVTERNTKH